MPSNYTGSSAAFTDTFPFVVDDDEPKAQIWRIPEQGVLDNTCWLKAQSEAEATRAQSAEAQLFTKQLLQLRYISLLGTSVSATYGTLGAAQRNRGTPLVILKDQQALGMGDSDRFVVQASAALGASHQTVEAVSNSSLVVALVNVASTGHASLAKSADDGATWAVTSTGLAFAAGHIIHVPAGATNTEYFVASVSGSPKLFAERASFAANDTISDSTVNNPTAGLAAWFDGTDYKIVICGDNGFTQPVFQQYHYASGAWSNSGGPTLTAPSGLGSDSGSLVGNAGTKIWHLGRTVGGALKVSVSSDGAVTWSTLATLSPQGSATLSARPRIMCCPNSGLLVIVAPTSGNQTALYASIDQGVTWLGPQVLFPDLGVNFALAGGRLFAAKDDGSGNTMLLATDGLGWA